MDNFEQCTVAMLGGPCLQHVTGNTSQLNQSQSAIMQNQDYWNPNIKSHLLSFLFELWKTVSVSYRVVQRMYTGNTPAMCLGFTQSSHVSWQR